MYTFHRIYHNNLSLCTLFKPQVGPQFHPNRPSQDDRTTVIDACHEARFCFNCCASNSASASWSLVFPIPTSNRRRREVARVQRKRSTLLPCASRGDSRQPIPAVDKVGLGSRINSMAGTEYESVCEDSPEIRPKANIQSHLEREIKRKL